MKRTIGEADGDYDVIDPAELEDGDDLDAFDGEDGAL